MRIARGLEDAFNRKVAWGARSREMGVLFTHLATPVMTRLRPARAVGPRHPGRRGVARSRADALAWCVRLVGQHEADWIARLQDAIKNVDEARIRSGRTDLRSGPPPRRRGRDEAWATKGFLGASESRRGLEPQPPVYKTGALPMRHVGRRPEGHG